MIKLRIACPWDTSENITERLLYQFKTPEIDLSNIEFVYNDTYDVAICLNYMCLDNDSNKQYYIFPHEPFWSGSHQKTFCDSNCTVFGFSEDGYEGNNLVTPAHTFYGGRGPWVDKLDIWNYNNISNIKVRNKTKGISSCITDINQPYGNYPKRINILNRLKNTTDIEFFGVGRLNGTKCNNSQYKIDCVEDFKFNLSIENDYYNNWVTEKFFDAILMDCVPIYYGCANIRELFPEDGYILLDNIDDMEYIEYTLTDIINNLDSIYNEKIQGVRKIKQRYFKENNLLKKIIESL